MSRQRTHMIEGILHQIENRIKEWHEQGMLHKSEAAAQRERLWAEAEAGVSERASLPKTSGAGLV